MTLHNIYCFYLYYIYTLTITLYSWRIYYIYIYCYWKLICNFVTKCFIIVLSFWNSTPSRSCSCRWARWCDGFKYNLLWTNYSQDLWHHRVQAVVHLPALGAGDLHKSVCGHLRVRGGRKHHVVCCDPLQEAHEDQHQHVHPQPVGIRRTGVFCHVHLSSSSSKREQQK